MVMRLLWHCATATCPLIKAPTAIMPSVWPLMRSQDSGWSATFLCAIIGRPQFQYIQNVSCTNARDHICCLQPATSPSIGYMFRATVVQQDWTFFSPHAMICAAMHRVVSSCEQDLQRKWAPSNWLTTVVRDIYESRFSHCTHVLDLASSAAPT